MIKLTLVKYIRQFSLKRSWQEFNLYFFQCLGITVGSVLVAYMGFWLYGRFFDPTGYWRQAQLLEVLGRLLEEGSNGSAKQLSLILSFNLMLMALVKMRRTQQMEQASVSPKMLESYVIGALITFLTMIVLGNGLGWLLNYDEFGYGHRSAIPMWINTLLNLFLPPLTFFLAFHFLRRGMETQAKTTWAEFWSVVFIYLIVSTFIAVLTVMFTTVVMQPVLMVFTFGGSLLSIVLAFILVISLLSFYVIMAADLLIILVKRKTSAAQPVLKSNPDLLDA